MSVEFASATLYDRDGSSPLGHFHRTTALQWLDELDGHGSFSVTVPAEDATGAVIGHIVKCSYGTRSDDYVFAGVIESIVERETDEAKTIELSGRGVRSLLEYAVVYRAAGSDSASREYVDAYPTAIMRELVEEAQARGAIPAVELGFTDAADSNGVPFGTDTDLTIAIDAGTTLSDVLEQHCETVLDAAWMDPQMVLHYALTRGTDTTTSGSPVTFRAGHSILALERRTEGPVRNATYITYGGGVGAVEKVSTVSGTVSSWGRAEQYLDLSNVSSAAKAQRYANAVMGGSAAPVVGVTLEATDDGPRPYLDYAVGDFVNVAGMAGQVGKFRVRAITITLDAEGTVRVVPELGTVRAGLDERLRRTLNRAEASTMRGDAHASAMTGGGSSGGSTSVPTYTFTPPLPVGTSSFYRSADLRNYPIDFTSLPGFPYFQTNFPLAALEDTENASGSGAGSIVFASSESGPQRLLTINTVSGTIQQIPLGGGNPVNHLVKWGSRILATLLTDGVTSFPVYLIDAGVVTTLALTPPVAGMALRGIGPAADGSSFMGVWTGSNSAVAYFRTYTAAGAIVGTQTQSVFSMASAGGSFAQIANGYVLLFHSQGNLQGSFLYAKSADLTDAMALVGSYDGSGTSANFLNRSRISTIAPDGSAFIATGPAPADLYRVDCRPSGGTGTGAHTRGISGAWADAFQAGETAFYNLAAISATKYVWTGQANIAGTYSAIYGQGVIGLGAANHSITVPFEPTVNNQAIRCWSPVPCESGDVVLAASGIISSERKTYVLRTSGP